MIQLSSATAMAKEDVESLAGAVVGLKQRLPGLSATAARHVKVAILMAEDVLKNPKPAKSDLVRAAKAMQRVATDEDVYPKVVRDRREEEQLDTFSQTREPAGQKKEESMMPVQEAGKMVEVLPFYRDEPQNRAGLTRSPSDPTRIAENIMILLSRRQYLSAQEAFDGHLQDGGPYYVASFDQKKRLACILRSYGFPIDFDEKATWALDNERRKGNRTIGYDKAEPQSRLPLALGKRIDRLAEFPEASDMAIASEQHQAGAVPGINQITNNFTEVSLPTGTTIWYSYKTPIAFQTSDGPVVMRQNDWGPTTGKHMSHLGIDKKSRIPGAEFEKQLEAVLGGKDKDLQEGLPLFDQGKKKHIKQKDSGAAPPQAGQSIAIPGGAPGSAPSAQAVRLSMFNKKAQRTYEELESLWGDKPAPVEKGKSPKMDTPSNREELESLYGDSPAPVEPGKDLGSPRARMVVLFNEGTPNSIAGVAREMMHLLSDEQVKTLVERMGI